MIVDTVLYHLLALLPCAAFAAGYRFTDVYFRVKMIPFPFEDFGAAAGAGCFFCTMGFVLLVWTFYQQWRGHS